MYIHIFFVGNNICTYKMQEWMYETLEKYHKDSHISNALKINPLLIIFIKKLSKYLHSLKPTFAQYFSKN